MKVIPPARAQKKRVDCSTLCVANSNKTTAAIAVLKLPEDPECYKKLQIGKSVFNRYSQKAIERIKEALGNKSIDAIWQESKSKRVIHRKSKK
jgi:hypothetical protein